MTTTAAAASALLPHVDELILEYLLFRGFTKSFQVLNAERKRDRAKAFDVEQIITQLLTFVQSYQLDPILDMWKFLEARFFSRLDASYSKSIRQLEDSWLRLYVVNAIKTGRCEKAIEFFKQLIYADKLNARLPDEDGDSWHRWFVLPYVHHPESDPYFKVYLTKGWLEAFVASFRNFLSLIFRNIPLPKLLALQVSRFHEPSMSLQLKASQSECHRLRVCHQEAEERIRKLEDTTRHLLESMQTMVQHAFADHFSTSMGGASMLADPVTAMNVLSEQLQTLNAQLVASAKSTKSVDRELAATLLDPLHVKLNAKTVNKDSDVDIPSPPSSSSEPSSASQLEPEHRRALEQVRLLDNVLPPVDASADGVVCHYSPDASKLVVARVSDKGFAVVRLPRGDATSLHDWVHVDARVIGAHWMSNSKRLLYALEDGTINIWDARSKKRTFTISYNTGDRYPVHLACSNSQPLGAVVLASKTRTTTSSQVQFFTIEDDGTKVISSVEVNADDIATLRWAPDGSVLVVAEPDGHISLLKPSLPHPVCRAQVLSDRQIGGLSFTGDSKSLLVVAADCSHVFQWSIDKLMEASNSSEPASAAQYVYEIPAGSSSDDLRCSGLHSHQSGPYFAVCCGSSDESTVTVFKDGQGEALASCTMTGSKIQGLSWHPNELSITALTQSGQLIKLTLS